MFEFLSNCTAKLRKIKQKIIAGKTNGQRIDVQWAKEKHGTFQNMHDFCSPTDILTDNVSYVLDAHLYGDFTSTN